MKARTIGLVLGLAITMAAGTAWGQVEVEWERTFGGESNETSGSIIQTEDSGFVLAGYTSSFGSGSGDFWLIRTDANGDSLWSRTFGGEYIEHCYSLVQTEDGGFAMLGDTLFLRNGTRDFRLVRTDAQGDSLWSRTFGGGRSDNCSSIIMTEDGGFVLTGSTSSFGSGDHDFWLVRTDGDGDSLWSRTFGGVSDDRCYSLLQTADGGFAMAGKTDSFGAGSGDFWLVRTDGDGDSLWSRTFGGVSDDLCTSLIETADGGFAMAGFTHSFDAGEYDFWLVRTDGNGDSLWSRTIGGGSSDYCTALIQTADGGFVMAGYSGSFGAGYDDFWLIRIDANGDSLWSSVFGGEGDDRCFSLIQTVEGGFALVGFTRSFGAGGSDIYFVKTTPDPVSVASSLIPHPSSFLLSPAFPNPFNSMVTIPFGLDKSAPTRLAIFDPLGRRVADLLPGGRVSSGTLNLRGAGTHSVVWDATGVPAGQYIIRLEAGNQQLSQRLSLVK